jgi:CubicO group peptidase (beta-lactamase class C family)
MSDEQKELQQAMITAFSNPGLKNGQQNTAAWRKAEIPAANGHTNAAALARLYGVLANGGESPDGVTIISRGGIQAMTRMNCFRRDLVLMFKVRWGMGFMLNDPLIGIQGPNLGAFGHSGAGGSIGFADPSTGLGFGYAMAKMSAGLNGDPRSLRLIEALYGCMGQEMRYVRDKKSGLPTQTIQLQSPNNGNMISGGTPVKPRL